MSDTFNEILHARIAKQCMARYRDGYFKDAAHEAMTQVELAIKEKSGVLKKYGVSLAGSVFGSGPGIKLRVPFGEHMQGHAKVYFEGAFSYYRNYAAHEGAQIDGPICLRILVMASDLLFLVGASTVSFTDVGGVEGLVKHGVFSSHQRVIELLSFLDDCCLPDEISDGFYEDLAQRSFEDKHLQSLFDCGLVEYQVNSDVDDPSQTIDRIGIFYLTPLGKSILAK
jgi:hypothetical protein